VEVLVGDEVAAGEAVVDDAVGPRELLVEVATVGNVTSVDVVVVAAVVGGFVVAAVVAAGWVTVEVLPQPARTATIAISTTPTPRTASRAPSRSDPRIDL
jgi:hypothetical protein